jgi:hypothetical protein
MYAENRQVGDAMFEKRSTMSGVSQILSGISDLISGDQNNQGFDLSMVGSILNALGTSNNVAKRSIRDEEQKEDHGIDWASVISMGSMFFQQNANNDMVMGLVPMVLEALGHGTNDDDTRDMDHSGHSWFLPPILENIHVMWEHFRYYVIYRM